MSNKAVHDVELELVSKAAGKELAEAWHSKPSDLRIPNTLLSSQDIVKVVERTGLISPFYTGGGSNARLKKASYEGRIGEAAYIYRDRNIPEKIYCSKSCDGLLVPKNSIVFVESDLDFRIPDFIALRFNLQIQHVHRGLLLGTGPLVDPGFWGKLCIPLHNLTDRDYYIPKDEGLIWIEFTKTSIPVKSKASGRDAIAGIKEHWDIKKLLDKAANQYSGEKIPIKSSISGAIEQFGSDARRSAKNAEEAKKATNTIRNVGTIAALGTVIGVLSLAHSYYSDVGQHLEETLPALEQVRTELSNHIDIVGGQAGLESEQANAVVRLQEQIDAQEAEIERLQAEIESLKPPARDANRPGG